MQVSFQRQTFMTMALALSLSLSLIVIALDESIRERLGEAYWLIGLALIGCTLLVLASYVFDRNLIQKIKDISHQTSCTNLQISSTSESDEHDPDVVMGLARKIEKMALSLQQTEASYRAIVEDQVDLICRYKADGRLTFVNGAYTRFFGKQRHELISQTSTLFSAKLTPWTEPESCPESASFESILTDSEGHNHVHLWVHRGIKNRDGVIHEYQAVGHDLTLRKEAERTLQDAKNAAETADRAKSEFLAIVSHEIRTPINGVVGFARLLRETTLTSEQTSYIETIHRCGVSMETLVADILDLSKIESGHLDIIVNPFSPRQCVEDTITLFAEQAQKANLTLTCEIADAVPHILQGDPHRIRQILNNLVANALKFTEKGGVTVRLSGSSSIAIAEEDCSSFILCGEIIDTGIGISVESIGRLFQPFSQVDTSTTRRHSGTGLGLVISKRLCNLMGGDIVVNSTPNSGSTFTFTVRVTRQKGDTRPPFGFTRSPAADVKQPPS